VFWIDLATLLRCRKTAAKPFIRAALDSETIARDSVTSAVLHSYICSFGHPGPLIYSDSLNFTTFLTAYPIHVFFQLSECRNEWGYELILFTDILNAK